MHLEPTVFKEVNLFDFEVTVILPLDVEAIASDSARGRCRSEILEESVGILGILVGGVD